MFIEDLIFFVTGTGPYLFSRLHVNLNANAHDETLLNSFGNQLERGSAFTEKQSVIALRILIKYKNNIRHQVPKIDDILSNPQWKMPFRSLPKVRKLAIEDVEGVRQITIEFPYESALIEQLKKSNNGLSHLHKGQWNMEKRKWVYFFNEENVARLGNMFLQLGFEADEEFATAFLEVEEIIKNVESHLPMLVKDDTFKIVNAHKAVPQPETNNLAEALFFARGYGINFWDDEVQSLIDAELNPVVKHMVSTTTDRLWVNSNVHTIDNFGPVIQYNSPTLIIIPGGTELVEVQKWTEFALAEGIKPSEISVMFRLPNEHAIFNQYVKEVGLNNPVEENTKVVFVSTKIPKPLVKSGIRFNTVINLGYYNYMHFTMSAAVENTRNLVYYSMKEPTERRSTWQQLK